MNYHDKDGITHYINGKWWATTHQATHVNPVDLIIHFKLQPAEWWILTCCGISHHCSPSYIPAVCGHYNDFFWGVISFTLFYLVSWFLSWIFSFCLLSFSICFVFVFVVVFVDSPSSISVQAAKLQWSLDEKLGSSRGTRVSRPLMCVCVFMFVCSTAQWFDFMRH